MSKYGKVALEAVQIAQTGICPAEAWKLAAESEFGSCVASIKKGCPKSSFLGLAEEGIIQGIPSGNYTRSENNKRYALEALRILEQNNSYVNNRNELWLKACKSEFKTHNGQIDVVISLWSNGLLI